MPRAVPRARRVLNALAIGLVAVASLLPIARLAQACSGSAPEPSGTETHFPLMYGDRPTIAQLSDLGRRIFMDPAYSASGKQSCASCHDPDRAFGPPNDRAVQLGGPNLDRTGFRNTPSLRYAHAPVAFTQHFLESQVTLGVDDEGPTGGRTWDGRVDTAHDQALMPLMDPNEMANADGAAVVRRLQTTAYADEFRRVLSAPGENVFDDPDSTLVWVTVALETYEQSAPEFHPFDSKFDAWLNDKATLSPAEARGMALFNDMKKGNCASCHPSTRKSAANRPPIFTDFGFVATGVPRNRALPANHDPTFFDLGLCGPLRTDLAAHPEYCGLFRTPSLRNVALRQRLFHNGAIRSLRDAVAFYATRDTDPARWYPDSHGQPGYDDLPGKYWGNVTREVPFQPLPGGRPRLDEREIDDIVAFLRTLTDGWKPPAKARGQAAATR